MTSVYNESSLLGYALPAARFLSNTRVRWDSESGSFAEAMAGSLGVVVLDCEEDEAVLVSVARSQLILA